MTATTERPAPANLPPLPPGWAPNEPPYAAAPARTAAAEPPPYVDEQPPPRTPRPAPPQSGAITTVAGVLGHDVTLHRAEYTVRSPRGEFTQHGYAWRCTNRACRHVTTGYPAQGFGRAHRDARGHDCRMVHHD